MTQRLVPCAPWMLAIPKMAISELVSKPRPNRTPSGYIFQGRSTIRNSFRNTFAMNPAPSSCRFIAAWSSSSPPSSGWCGSGSRSTWRNRVTRRYSTQPLPRHSRMRKAALTDVPTMPPMYWKLSKRSRSAPDVAATTMQVMMTMVEWPRLKKVPTVTGRWPEAISRRVIRSMAEMWSASRACRRPSVYDRTAGEIMAG